VSRQGLFIYSRFSGHKNTKMENATDPLAPFGLDAIDLRWTMKDIAAKRWHMTLNEAHVTKLIELGLVEMRDERPVLTIAGQNAVWDY
jgi:hypothetical protein